MSTDIFSTVVLLSKADQSINSYRSTIAQLTQQKALLEHNVEQKHAELEKKQQECHGYVKKEHALELETKSIEQQLIKAKEKSLFCADAKAYDSIYAEIDRLKQKRQELDEQLMVIWDEKAACQKLLNVLEPNYQALQAQIKQQIEAHEKQIMQAKHDMQQVFLQRERFIPDLKELRSAYEAMSQRVADPIGIAQGSFCAVCDTVLPKGEQVRLARRAIVTCPSCFRLLYDPTVQ